MKPLLIKSELQTNWDNYKSQFKNVNNGTALDTDWSNTSNHKQLDDSLAGNTDYVYSLSYAGNTYRMANFGKIKFTFTSNRTISAVDNTKITVEGGTLSLLTNPLSDSKTYEAIFTPNSANVDCMIDINQNTFTDEFNYKNKEAGKFLFKHQTPWQIDLIEQHTQTNNNEKVINVTVEGYQATSAFDFLSISLEKAPRSNGAFNKSAMVMEAITYMFLTYRYLHQILMIIQQTGLKYWPRYFDSNQDTYPNTTTIPNSNNITYRDIDDNVIPATSSEPLYKFVISSGSSYAGTYTFNPNKYQFRNVDTTNNPYVAGSGNITTSWPGFDISELGNSNLNIVSSGISSGISTANTETEPHENRQAGTYLLDSLSGSVSGTGAGLKLVVDASGAIEKVEITNPGTGFSVDETITIPDTSLMNGGAPDVVVTVCPVADDINLNNFYVTWWPYDTRTDSGIKSWNVISEEFEVAAIFQPSIKSITTTKATGLYNSGTIPITFKFNEALRILKDKTLTIAFNTGSTDNIVINNTPVQRTVANSASGLLDTTGTTVSNYQGTFDDVVIKSGYISGASISVKKTITSVFKILSTATEHTYVFFHYDEDSQNIDSNNDFIKMVSLIVTLSGTTLTFKTGEAKNKDYQSNAVGNRASANLPTTVSEAQTIWNSGSFVTLATSPTGNGYGLKDIKYEDYYDTPTDTITKNYVIDTQNIAKLQVSSVTVSTVNGIKNSVGTKFDGTNIPITSNLDKSIEIDTTSPTFQMITNISSKINIKTPSITIKSTELGTVTTNITQGISAGINITSVDTNHVITFNELPDGEYNDKKIIVTDTAGNTAELNINNFEINTQPLTVTITSTSGVTSGSRSNDSMVNFKFVSNKVVDNLLFQIL